MRSQHHLWRVRQETDRAGTCFTTMKNIYNPNITSCNVVVSDYLLIFQASNNSKYKRYFCQSPGFNLITFACTRHNCHGCGLWTQSLPQLWTLKVGRRKHDNRWYLLCSFANICPISGPNDVLCVRIDINIWQTLKIWLDCCKLGMKIGRRHGWQFCPN